MRNNFDIELKELEQKLKDMATLCCLAVSNASTALNENNLQVASEAIKGDELVNQKENEIETFCLRLFMKEQPVASDLHRISAVLKIITDLERIGDQAADISEITLSIKKSVLDYSSINKMFKVAENMIKNGIEAFADNDLKKAQKVIDSDDILDELFVSIKNNLIESISKDKSCGEEALDYLMIAKYLERIGDHSTNVAEWVQFSILGYHKNN